MPFRRELVLANEHLRAEDRRQLYLRAGLPRLHEEKEILCYRRGAGWQLDFTEALRAYKTPPRFQWWMQTSGFTDELADILAYAYEAGTSRVSFEPRAKPEPGFPLFDPHTDEEITARQLARGVAAPTVEELREKARQQLWTSRKLIGHDFEDFALGVAHRDVGTESGPAILTGDYTLVEEGGDLFWSFFQCGYVAEEAVTPVQDPDMQPMSLGMQA